MRFITIRTGEREQATVVRPHGLVALDLIDPELSGDLLTLIRRRPEPADLADLARRADTLDALAVEDVNPAPPYRNPGKIWGIGLNYRDHAADLSESAPDQPASFIKGAHTIVGPGDDIVIPVQSQRTTAEAELGLVFGGPASRAGSENPLDQLFGVTSVLDQTAEDILALNPRYLTRSKNFRSFFSFGPEVVTLDEFLAEQTIEDVQVTTFLDGAVVRSNTVANMTHSPSALVSFHTAMMPFEPGDLLSTGTPGAGVLHDGAVARAEVSGLAPLQNPVRAG